MPTEPQNHKEAAIAFLQMIAAGKIKDAYSTYVAPDFRHHNAYFKGDADSLKAGMEESAAKNPNKTLDCKQIMQDGDLVTILSHVKQNPEDRGAALVHIFRFKDGLIAELWDVGQAIPEENPNENGMF